MNQFFLKFLPYSLRKKIENNKEFQKIIININWLTFENVFRMGLGLFVTAMVARYLGPEKYGMMNYALVFVALFLAFSKLGLDNIVVRNLVNNPKKSEEYLGSSLFLKFFGSIVLFLASFIAIIFVRPESPLIQSFVVIIAFGYIFQSFEVIDFWFQSCVKSKYVAISKSLAFLVVSVIRLYLIFIKAPLILFVCMFSIEFILISIGFVYFYLKNSPVQILNWKVKFNVMKELLHDSWPLILSKIAVMIYLKIDQIMIGNLLGNTELGIYSAAVKLSEVWYFVPVVISASVFPAILNSRKKSEKLYLSRMQLLYNLFTWFAVPVALIISVLSPVIINILYGPEYFASSSVLSIHIWAGVFVFWGVLNGKYLISENLTKISFYITIFGAILNIILNIFLIPIFGIIGAAYSTLISYAFVTLFIGFFKQSRVSLIMIFKSLGIN